MERHKKGIDSESKYESWYKAGVIAGIWASFEIIFGGVFHSLRLPFAGTALSFFSIVLLTAFAMRWQGKYLFLKAALMAGILRSVMPFTVILGPFIGILIEGLIFQVFYQLGKKKRIVYYPAGILIMFSALIHKLISLLIIYGWDLVRIGESLYASLQKTTHLSLRVEVLIGITGGIYVLLGIMAVSLGIRIGNKKDSSADIHLQMNPGISKQSSIFETFSDFTYHPIALLLIPVAGIIIIFITDRINSLYYLLLSPLYVILLSWRYHRVMRKLTKVFFWLQMLIITLFIFLLWEDKSQAIQVSGKLMSRALIVVSMLSAISMELRNPVVKTMIERKGAGGMYATLEAISGIIPYLLDTWGKYKNKWFNPLKLLSESINLSETLLDYLINEANHTCKIFIITAEVGGGKTTALRAKMNNFKNQKKGGIILHSIYEKQSIHSYEMEILGRRERIPYASVEPMKDSIKTGRFYISNQAIKLGNKALNRLLDENYEIICLDEIGPLEMRNGGWHSFIMQWKNLQNRPTLVVSIRKKLLQQIIRKYFKECKTQINLPDGTKVPPANYLINRN